MAATRRRRSETPVPASGSDDSSDGGAAKGFECNVCLEPASEPVITRCGHLYCWPCLHRWIERHAGPAPCPVCKAAVTADTCTPIYGRGMDPEVADPRMRTRTRNTRSGVVAASAPGRPAATYVAAPEPIMAAAAGGDPIILGGHNPLDAQTISVSYAPGIGLIPGLFGLTLCARRRAPMHPWESLELRRHKATLNAALVAAVGALVAAIVLL